MKQTAFFQKKGNPIGEGPSRFPRLRVSAAPHGFHVSAALEPGAALCLSRPGSFTASPSGCFQAPRLPADKWTSPGWATWKMDDLSSPETGSGRTRPSTPMFAGLHIDRSDIPRGPETPQPDALWVQLAYTVEIFETRKVELGSRW